MDADAVVVGAGPNGLVAANVLADAGWDVVLLEAAAVPGGGVRSADIAAPGFRADLCSAFYPFAACSPILSGLELERHGLVWRHAPAVLAHVLPDGRSVLLHRDPLRTADKDGPDIGALPLGAEPWGLGVNGRIGLFAGRKGPR